MPKNVTTYLQLRDLIQTELQRNDSNISTIIENAITDAIRHFKDECFAINQSSATISVPKYDSTKHAELTIDPLYYAYVNLPYDFSSLIDLRLNKDGTMYEMINVTYPEIDEMDALITEVEDGVVTKTPHTGTPQYYAYFGDIVQTPAGPGPTAVTEPGKIRIFPQPDTARTLHLRYVSNLNDPKDASNTDSVAGFWMNEAQRMIKAYAKGIIYADYLQQYEQAQAQEVLAQAEYNRLVGRSEARALQNPVMGYI